LSAGNDKEFLVCWREAPSIMEFYTCSFRILVRDNLLDFYNNRPQKLGSITIQSFIEAFGKTVAFWDDGIDLTGVKESDYGVIGRYYSSKAGLHFIQICNGTASYNVLRHGRVVLVVPREFKDQFHLFIEELKNA